MYNHKKKFLVNNDNSGRNIMHVLFDTHTPRFPTVNI